MYGMGTAVANHSMTDSEKVNKILERHTRMKNAKQPWMYSWQMIGQYVMTRKQNFLKAYTPGVFLTGRLFDSTAQQANHQMASSIIGALFPNGGRSFQFMAPLDMPEEVANSQPVKEFYKYLTNCVAAEMDNPRSGFRTSYEEYMFDQGSFGTSGILVEKNDTPGANTTVRYAAVDAKKICIDEGPDGFVDTVYIEQEMTVKQVVQKYGIDAVSEDIRGLYNRHEYEQKKFVLHAIEPRTDRAANLYGNTNYPIASIHIEMDSRKILQESGFEDMPVFVARFWKGMGELYGRSPAFESMPDIVEANILRKMLIVATEKTLNPPLAVTHDSVAGGGTIDTSAGAVNTRHVSGRITDNGKWIEPIMTIGELRSTQERVGELREQIRDGFFIDRLTDLSKDSRMTLGEANIRNRLRGQSLGIIYSRQTHEMLTPCIIRTAILLLNFKIKKDKIPPVIMEMLQKGEDILRVHYMSPAASIMRVEELSGIQQTLQIAIELAQVSPNALDNIDIDETVRRIAELTGAPVEIVNQVDEVKQIRDARAQAQQQQAALEARKISAETARAAGKAALDSAKAGVPLGAIMNAGGGDQQAA